MDKPRNYGLGLGRIRDTDDCCGEPGRGGVGRKTKFVPLLTMRLFPSLALLVFAGD